MNIRTDRYEWRVGNGDRREYLPLARALDIPPLVGQILWQRGVRKPEDGARFLNPSMEHVSPPSGLTDMDRAAARIAQARDRGEHVLVFGDYDADGITGAALLSRALRRFGLREVDTGLPRRLEEGYGLAPVHVDTAAKAGVDLIITVDNGTTAYAAAEAAAQAGVDLIITDHHQLGGELPPAFAVINPQRESAEHPCRNLAGVGVALKLAWALTGEPHDLDLAALGTVADIVPLTGENRDIVAAGLEAMNRAPRLGLDALAAAAGLRKGPRTARQLAFQLGPRINAGGRLGDGRAGLDLLLTDDPTEARTLAKELGAANEERRAIEQDMLDDALAELDETFTPGQRSIVLSRRSWHPGVIGIVASRVQRRYYRPAVLIALGEDGMGRGSARSIAGFDIAGALRECAGHLEGFGGHHQAAGMRLAEAEISAFRDSFEARAAQALPSGDLRPVLEADVHASLSEIDARLIANLQRLEPCGHGNPAPILVAQGCHALPNSIRELRNGHMRMAARQEGAVLQCVGFGLASLIPALQAAESVDLAFTPSFNEWRGETTIQLELKDVRCESPAAVCR